MLLPPNGLHYPRWGAGTAKPSTEKRAEAGKTPKKCADSPASSARGVRCGDWIRTRPLNILPRSSRGRARKGFALSRSSRRALFEPDFSRGFESLILFLCPHLTVCVTRGWAGGGGAVLLEPTSSQQTAEKRGDSHPSGARCVGRRLT